MADVSTSGSSATADAPATPRYDFYQTDTVLTLSIFVKAASQESLQIDIAESSLYVKAISSITGSEYVLRIEPLFSTVDVTNSSYKVLSTKIDVVLHKAQPGLRWLSLKGASAQQSAIPVAAPTNISTQAAKPAAPRTKSKWDSFDPDADDDTAKGPAGAAGGGGDEADINKFFQKLYADADPDTRRAMMKSYQESGGTTLSTDWSKVGKEEVRTHPPDGMEAKKW
ncbi:CS domain protein [Kalmanozyma brasiliensis GHG001]|uniref:Uncharacterized protein n=1 Tax=Kalmanozyma brasiliensis (strain GHG001) TaxID=1365824 RepID=V5EN89_KALBG|nr:CS domain protein [Kalmanozyma brasiliensis GHG001]EST06535.1 CS domain protein [Kalmanozyma brasiliensis GHG001]